MSLNVKLSDGEILSLMAAEEALAFKARMHIHARRIEAAVDHIKANRLEDPAFALDQCVDNLRRMNALNTMLSRRRPEYVQAHNFELPDMDRLAEMVGEAYAHHSAREAQEILEKASEQG